MECDFLPGVSAAVLEEEIKTAALASGKKQISSLVPENCRAGWSKACYARSAWPLRKKPAK